MDLKEIYEQISKNKDTRANLIELKSRLKDQANIKELYKIAGGNFDNIMKLLVDADAKVRKNAATVLGQLKSQDALDILMDAYEEEEKLFVKAEYVNAMAELKCEEYLDRFKDKLNELVKYKAPEEEKKHIQEEIHALNELISRHDKRQGHKFIGENVENDVMFMTLPAFTEALGALIPGAKKMYKAGVRTVTERLDELSQIRFYSEILFAINPKQLHDQSAGIAAGNRYFEEAAALTIKADDAADLGIRLKYSDMYDTLSKNHTGKSAYRFRVALMGVKDVETRSKLTKSIAAAVEDNFRGKLINSASNYEIELRVICDKEGKLTPWLKLNTFADERFAYRKFHVATSIKPYIAAGIMEVCKPYLKQDVQILDPFCGVGTMIIERRFAGTVRNAYGLDIFGEAIEKARLNTKITGMQANYINRDYFSFIHDYKFDEIVTDMPTGSMDKTELDGIYKKFFEHSADLLEDGARLIIFSKEMGLIKKHLRINNGYKLLKEIVLREKSGECVYVLEKK